MLIRIEFEDLETSETRNTMSILYGSPTGGYCLDSKNSRNVTPKSIRDTCGFSVSYWYVDVDVLNKYYGGVLSALNNIKKMSGVSSVMVIPYNDKWSSYEEIDKFIETYSV